MNLYIKLIAEQEYPIGLGSLRLTPRYAPRADYANDLDFSMSKRAIAIPISHL
ncbi:MAG: hypothetical protein MUE44_07275 [Oscillatoriaceae cyanobacterium Prado104]|nr:hypothetical protein [Oscillatoriaceae cyanobacterium Prado104]